MCMLKKMLLISTAALLVSGCASVTNLTPSQVPRDESGLYPFEMIFNTKATSVAHDSVQPYLMLGGELIPMERTPLLTHRWEVLAPIPAGKELVNYQYKVNYQWKDLGKRKENSKLSEPFELRIQD